MKFDEAIAKLGADTKDKILACKNVEEMIKLFADNGIQITKEEIEVAISKKSGELSDDELENVTGGLDFGQIIREIIMHFAKEAKDNIKGQ